MRVRVGCLGQGFILILHFFPSEPEERDYVLEGQVLHPEVGVVLSALRFELNIGWLRHPAGRCA